VLRTSFWGSRGPAHDLLYGHDHSRLSLIAALSATHQHALHLAGARGASTLEVRATRSAEGQRDAPVASGIAAAGRVLNRAMSLTAFA
jgi:hypothetical protein